MILDEFAACMIQAVQGAGGGGKGDEERVVEDEGFAEVVGGRRADDSEVTVSNEQ
jgi:hypothetical protein